MSVVPDDLEAVLARIDDPRRHLFVMDFDGTLAEIVDDPKDASPAPGGLEALRRLADVTDVAVLSGRTLPELERLLDGAPTWMLAEHGAVLRTPDGGADALVNPQAVAAALNRAATEMEWLLTDHPGWRIERKTASIAVHFRQADGGSVRDLLPRVRDLLHRRGQDPPGWELLEGKAFVELSPHGINKGEAITYLRERYPDRRFLVFGDDFTDEPAFEQAVALGGVAIVVAERPRPTAATWRLENPGRVVRLLDALGRQARAAATVGTPSAEQEFPPIGDYGMIGDSRTAALVSAAGSIDWMCAPRFDSPSLFAAILDPVRGGRFQVRPATPLAVERSYLGDTNVLVTRFVDGAEPVLALTDFLVFSRVNAFDPDVRGHLLVRRIQALEDVEVDVVFQPRFDFGRAHTRLHRTDTGVMASAGTRTADLDLGGLDLDIVDHDDGRGHAAVGRWRLEAGDVRWLVLGTEGADASPHAHLSPEEMLELTVRTWGRWARMISYDGPWRDEVVRSALVLKALVYEPTGALVAAPTTSLPEGVGGTRNWDYRYAWIRDSAYVLECFLRIGHAREAETFIRWLAALTDRIGGAHSLRPLYRITGGDDLTEVTLDHLRGYRDSRPVRVGNAAAEQLQLDIFGAVMELGYLTERLGGEIPSAQWSVIVELVDTVERLWSEPDAGLWEIRSEPRHHTYSKLQCWLAIDRAVRIGQELGLRGPYSRWRLVADGIRQSLLTDGWNDELGAFTQSYGGTALDASLLALPLRGLLPATDPRVASHVRAIRDQLEVADGLLLRYRSEDGLEGSEGAFLLCSFWLVELLARMGDLREAVRLFERLRQVAGPLGLYAEEVDARTLEQLGNFPQGFTHMGLISAATAIDEELRARNRRIQEFSPAGTTRA